MPETFFSLPDGYHTITPCLVVKGAQKLLDFLKNAFDAEETFCFRGENGTIAHAELQIGDSIVMLSAVYKSGVQSRLVRERASEIESNLVVQSNDACTQIEI